MNVSLMKQPSAFLPMAMSLAALALVLVTLRYSASCMKPTRNRCSSLAIMAGQVPVIAYFAEMAPAGQERRCACSRCNSCWPRSMCPVYWFNCNARDVLRVKCLINAVTGQVDRPKRTCPVTRAVSAGRCNTIWYKFAFKDGVYDRRKRFGLSTIQKATCGGVGRRDSRCMRLGVRSARVIHPFAVWCRFAVGLFR
jgi:hypothetical protein